MVLIVVAAVLFINSFGVQAFKIPSGSMLPTLQIGDHLFVNRFIYGLRLPFTGKLLVPISEPKRGDVVVFRFPKDPSTDYIKRVVGLPGDTVEIRDKLVYINGAQATDPHAHFTDGMIPDIARGPRDEFGPVQVPKGSFFVMGDNRDNSYDSRFWGFVPEENILGKAFIIYWSWDLQQSLASLDRWRSIRWNRIFDLIN
ncbi:MAG: signal peptidase I [Desulfobulbaceae bacterium]|nr:signal peptidase I [Desulfobulbaceae bacterium]